MDNSKEKEIRERLNTLLKALEEIENMPDKDYEKEILCQLPTTYRGGGL